MKIVKRKIKDLISAEYNPRMLTTKQHTELTDSLKRFGLVDPILVNINKERENIIIGGHQRVKVWQQLGNTDIDCVELDLTLDKERELNIRLNKNTGQFDMDMLANHFEQDELISWGFNDYEVFGGSDAEDDEKDSNEGSFEDLPQSVQLLPPKEYILILFDDAEQFDHAKEELDLQLVRRGGYEKGTAQDQHSIERVLTYDDLKLRLCK